MEDYQPVVLAQKSKVSNTQYDVEKFTKLLLQLNGEQFNLFCKEIIFLTEFHDTNIGAICTDDENNVADRSKWWQLKDLDTEQTTASSSD